MSWRFTYGTITPFLWGFMTVKTKRNKNERKHSLRLDGYFGGDVLALHVWHDNAIPTGVARPSKQAETKRNETKRERGTYSDFTGTSAGMSWRLTYGTMLPLLFFGGFSTDEEWTGGGGGKTHSDLTGTSAGIWRLMILGMTLSRLSACRTALRKGWPALVRETRARIPRSFLTHRFAPLVKRQQSVNTWT
jgi:hypothetical protein